MTRLIYIFLVLLFAVFLYIYLPGPQTYWVVCTALILAFIFSGNAFHERLVIVFCTGAISATGVLVAGYLNYSFLLTLMYLVLITLVLQLFSHRYVRYHFATIIINAFIIIAVALPISWTENISRATFILYATAIVMLCQCVFLYHYQQRTLNAWMVVTLQQLRWLSVEIFACFTEPAYPDNLYLFERRLHLQKIKVIQSLNHVYHATMLSKKNDKQTMSFNQLTQIYYLLLSLAKLRWRITDFTTLRLCQNEMQAITKALNQIFSSLIAKLRYPTIQVETYPLSQAIIRLEENYQQVLNVAAREPLVFLLFINDLKALNSELHDIFA